MKSLVRELQGLRHSKVRGLALESVMVGIGISAVVMLSAIGFLNLINGQTTDMIEQTDSTFVTYFCQDIYEDFQYSDNCEAIVNGDNTTLVFHRTNGVTHMYELDGENRLAKKNGITQFEFRNYTVTLDNHFLNLYISLQGGDPIELSSSK